MVMYYNLSPLFLDYFDILARTIYLRMPGSMTLKPIAASFSSLLGQLGIPTYSSTGYDSGGHLQYLV